MSLYPLLCDETVSSAVDQATTAMPDDFLIKPFLEAHAGGGERNVTDRI